MDNRAFDLSVALQSIPALLSYLDVTLIVGILSIILGSLLGFVLASFKLSQHKSLKYDGKLLKWVITVDTENGIIYSSPRYSKGLLLK